jgi:glycosyltransferase involved in cell wall biosynthesis
MAIKIGFVSTRFSGTDGVTLEANKWAEVLEEHGYEVFWFAGELNKDEKNSLLVPKAHFKDPENMEINELVFGRKSRPMAVTDSIHAIKHHLKLKLREFIDQFNIDLLIIQNALTIPLQIPLGVALTETIVERQIPTIAHHHDFYWERTRFLVNAVEDYIQMAFPPKLPSMEHVVINSSAQEELALRTGIASIIIPNVLDFEDPPKINLARSEKFKESIGMSKDDFMILQPTRIVQRKGIEHAIDFVRQLNNPAYKLCISHEAGDEGFEYSEWITQEAENVGVDLKMIKTSVDDPWNHKGGEQDRFSLWDVYPHADFITFPSLYEGFGNAFLEALYFKKPILINRYSIFVRDIEPMGFDLVIMDQFLTKKVVEKGKLVLEDAERRKKMVETNYELALKHFSYKLLWKNLSFLLTKFFGLDHN